MQDLQSREAGSLHLQGDGVAAPAHAVPVPVSLKGAVARYLAHIHSALLQADCLTLHCSIV